MVIRELVTVLRLNVDETKLASFENRLKGMKEGLAKFNEVLMAGMAVGVFGEMISKTAEAFDELNDSAMGLGMSTDGLTRLKFMAESTGGNFSEMTTALLQMNRAMGSARLQPDGPANKAIQRLGLNLKDLLAMKPEEQFDKLAETIAEVPNPADRARVAMDLFGRGAKGMLPMLSRGKEKLDKLRESFGQFAPLTKEQKYNLEKLAFAQNVLRLSFVNLATHLTSVVAPVFTVVSQVITKLVAAFTNASPGMKTFISSLVMMATILPILVIALGTMTSILPVIGAGFDLLLGPLMPVIAGMTLLFFLLQDMYVYSQGKHDSLFGRLMGKDIQGPQWLGYMKRELIAIRDLMSSIADIIEGKGWQKMFDWADNMNWNVAYGMQGIAQGMGLNNIKKVEEQTRLTNSLNYVNSKVGDIHFHMEGSGRNLREVVDSHDPKEQKRLEFLRAQAHEIIAGLEALNR